MVPVAEEAGVQGMSEKTAAQAVLE